MTSLKSCRWSLFEKGDSIVTIGDRRCLRKSCDLVMDTREPAHLFRQRRSDLSTNLKVNEWKVGQIAVWSTHSKGTIKKRIAGSDLFPQSIH